MTDNPDPFMGQTDWFSRHCKTNRRRLLLMAGEIIAVSAPSLRYLGVGDDIERYSRLLGFITHNVYLSDTKTISNQNTFNDHLLQAGRYAHAEGLQRYLDAVRFLVRGVTVAREYCKISDSLCADVAIACHRYQNAITLCDEESKHWYEQRKERFRLYQEVPNWNPAWRTANARDLAKVIHDGEKWDLLPILADAVMDAGCEDEYVLNVLRGKVSAKPKRGCWILDQLSGYLDCEPTL